MDDGRPRSQRVAGAADLAIGPQTRAVVPDPAANDPDPAVPGGPTSFVAFVLANPRFLAFGFALTFFSSFGQTFFIALFGAELRAEFALTHGLFGTLYAIATLSSGLCLLTLGRTIDTVDLRLYTTLVCVGLIGACVLMAISRHAAMLVIALFALRLTGQGLLGHTAMTSMARYFDHARGRALSVAALGWSAGEASLPTIAVFAAGRVGWRGTWLLLAGVLAVVLVPLVLWLLRGQTQRDVRHRREVEAAAASAGGQRAGAGGRQWTRGEAIRDPRFHLVLPAALAPAFVVTGIFFHQSHLIEEKGWDATFFASCFAAFAAAQLPASIGAGPLVDRLGAARLLPFYLVPLVAGLLVLGLSSHDAAAIGFMTLAGVTSGMCSPILGALWAEMYGVRHLGAIRAMVSSLMVFSTAASPALIGLLVDRGTTMATTALWMAAGTVAASLLTWVRRRP